jgi:hypothetical protein
MKKPYMRPELQVLDQIPSELRNRRRSQRVALQIAVLIRTETGDGQQTEVRALTLVVNAHGGLLQSSFVAEANQRITLVNPKTGLEVRCRVVRIDQSSSEMTTMAFEFNERTAQFWPISFPPEDWEERAS